MKISAWIAKTGSNLNFIAFMAHFWFSYSVVFTSIHFKLGLRTAMAVVVLAMIKEFWFDKHYEANQAFRNNLLDWVGYAAGAALAVAVAVIP